MLHLFDHFMVLFNFGSCRFPISIGEKEGKLWDQLCWWRKLYLHVQHLHWCWSDHLRKPTQSGDANGGVCPQFIRLDSESCWFSNVARIGKRLRIILGKFHHQSQDPWVIYREMSPRAEVSSGQGGLCDHCIHRPAISIQGRNRSYMLVKCV